MSTNEKYPGFLCSGKCDKCLFHAWRKLFDTSDAFNLKECNSLMINRFNLSILTVNEYTGRNLQIKAFEDAPSIDNDQFICQYNGNAKECKYCEVYDYADCIGYKMIGQSEDHWRLFQSPDGTKYSCKSLLKELCGVSIVENNAYIKYASILLDSSKLKPLKNRLKSDIITQIKGKSTVIVNDDKIPDEVSWYISDILRDVSKETKKKVTDHQITIAEASHILIDEEQRRKEIQEENVRKRKEKEFQDRLKWFSKFLYSKKYREVYDTIFDAPICCGNCKECRIYKRVYASHGIECSSKTGLRSKCRDYAKLYEEEIIDLFNYFRISEMVESENHGGITYSTVYYQLPDLAKKYLVNQKFIKDKIARIKKEKEKE